MSQVRETEFKGNPLCAIYRGEDDRFPFQFGVRKAKMILDHIGEIKAFYKRHAVSEE